MKTRRIAALALTFALAVVIAGMGADNFGSSPSLTGQEVSAEVMTVKTAAKAKKSDAEKYMEQVRDVYHDYCEHSNAFVDALKKADYAKARKALDDSDKDLKKLEGIKAPKKYAAKQKKLAKAAAREHEYNDICREFIGLYEKYDRLEKVEDPTEKDMKEAVELAQDIEKVNEKLESFDSGLGDIFLDTVKTVKADINGK